MVGGQWTAAKNTHSTRGKRAGGPRKKERTTVPYLGLRETRAAKALTEEESPTIPPRDSESAGGAKDREQYESVCARKNT